MAEIQELAALHQRHAGPVELSVDPVVAELPASLLLTIYRIVQEALTNARRHSPSAAVRITLAEDLITLVVEFENDALPPRPRPGRRDRRRARRRAERVALFGGNPVPRR